MRYQASFVVAVMLVAGSVRAQPGAVDPAGELEEAEAPESPLGKIEIHGFASEGAFWSTANDYLGESSRGTLELFEAALNVSSEVSDRLRAGIQLYARDIGKFDTDYPRIDWAFLDYRWKEYLGIRAGIIKMPFGLYNEYADIDSARLSILMPQGIYPVRNREALLAHRGFAVYGSHRVGAAGALDYQAWLGSLSVPEDALTLAGADLERIDTKYITGAQVFWRTPITGLRLGGTWLRTSIDFHVQLPPDTVEQLVMAGLVPPDYTGALVVSQRPASQVIASLEYQRGDSLFALEYGRSFKLQQTSLPMLIPSFDEDRESFYALATHRPHERFELGGYYSVSHLDANDRLGRDMKWAERHHAFQRDLAVTLRYDVNDHWLWKLEGHFIDGTADVDVATNPKRYWGLFLLRTTVSF